MRNLPTLPNFEYFYQFVGRTQIQELISLLVLY